MAADYQGRWTIEDIGTLDQVAFTAAVSLPAADTFSITFWYCATDTRRRQVILRVGDVMEARLEADALIVETFASAAPAMVLSAPAGERGAWQHVAIIASDALQLYVNGRLKSAPPLAGPVIVQPESMLHIGGYTDSAGGHFDYTFGRNQTGWVDDVRWYSRPLKPDEVARLIPQDAAPADIQIAVRAEETGGRISCAVHTAQPDALRLFLWDFGDQSSGLGAEIAHDYSFNGVYTVRLMAIDHSYRQIIREQQVIVQGAGARLPVYSVFANGSDGHACYRIPSIVRAANGDLVAFAEARLADCSDSTPTIRLVCRRSSDGGRTWSPVQIVARNIVDGRECAVQNSAPVVDTVYGTGRIIVLYNKLEHSEWALTDGTGTSRICCVFSDDNGVTWHSETDITAQVHRPAIWRVQRPTLGHAIQLASGRLLFAGVCTEGGRSVFQSQNYLFWSDDLGATWTVGPAVPHIGLNEAIAVELENGDVMINSRAYHDEKPAGRRAVTIARFIDRRAVAYEPTRYDDALTDPAVQASIIRFTASTQSQYGGRSRLLFANPNHRQARYNLTVRLSYDEGATWPVGRTIDPGPSAYSDLVIQDDLEIGVLYERGNHGGIVYTRFTIDWLTDGHDTLRSAGDAAGYVY